MLLVVAILFARSLGSLTHVDAGFRRENVLLFGVSAEGSGLNAAERVRVYERLRQRFDEQCLAQARHTLDQHVPLREQPDQHLLHELVLPDQHAADLGFHARQRLTCLFDVQEVPPASSESCSSSVIN